MCRLMAYMGPKTLLAPYVTKAEHSLIHQSYQAKSWCGSLNGDGVGIGWYDFDVDSTPSLFKDAMPAWNNPNLLQLCEKLRSPLFFAHVRAATGSTGITYNNCHPFRHQNYLWMHNGQIQDFLRLKRALLHEVGENYFHHIQGSTDSELIFALFLTLLEKCEGSQLQALQATIQFLNDLTLKAKVAEHSHYNFVFSDGVGLMASRIFSGGVAPKEDKDHALFYRTLDNGALLIASEILGLDAEEIQKWQEVPSQSILIKENLQSPIKIISVKNILPS